MRVEQYVLWIPYKPLPNRPRIEQGNTVQKPELLRAASRATGIVEGTLDQSIKELRDQIIEFSRAGRTVKVDGLGTFSPTIDLEGGTLSVPPSRTGLARGGQMIAMLITGSGEPEVYSEADVTFFSLVANQVALAIDDALNFGALQASGLVQRRREITS